MADPLTLPFGQFAAVPGLTEHEIVMLYKGLEAIQQVQGSWAFLANFNDANGFMFAERTPMHEQIDEAVCNAYPGHSGGSYGFVMRHLQYIARHGWGPYVDLMRAN